MSIKRIAAIALGTAFLTTGAMAHGVHYGGQQNYYGGSYWSDCPYSSGITVEPSYSYPDYSYSWGASDCYNPCGSAYIDPWYGYGYGGIYGGVIYGEAPSGHKKHKKHKHDHDHDHEH